MRLGAWACDFKKGEFGAKNLSWGFRNFRAPPSNRYEFLTNKL